jgi:hypothetical protein
MMSSENIKPCNYILKCIAPFCPEIKSVNGVWYPAEAICKRRFHSSLKWIKKQRRIARKSIYRDFYFSQDDLERIQRVTRKTMGRNPDKDNPRYPTQNHPEFTEKTVAKTGVSCIACPSTPSTATNGKKFVITQNRQD